jgi:hypothetical protein
MRQRAAGDAMQPAVICAALVLVTSCADPVHDRAVDALGPEAPGVRPGPKHRPGQPCLTCHGGDGPSSLIMSFAGTVYQHESSNDPAEGAIVRVVDAEQRTYETPTNSAGNFWIPAGRFEPTFPVSAAVTLGQYSGVMRTTMRLDGSCNGCHVHPQNASSPGRLWVLPDSASPM